MHLYEKPSVATDIVVFTIGKGRRKTGKCKRHLQLLLIRRRNHPFQGIAGRCQAVFVNIDESLRDAAARELYEETGLEPDYLGQLYTWGEVDRDPRTRIISNILYGNCEREK